MVLTLKVKPKDTEAIKNILIKEDLIDRTSKIQKQGAEILIPVKKEIKNNLKLIKQFDYKIASANMETNEKINNIYDYLKTRLNKENLNLVPSSFDIIGDIAILEIDKNVEKIETKIADAILAVHHNIKTVVKKASEHSGEFRIQKTKHLAGKKNKTTIYKESGARIKLNIDNVYFSPRLGNERLRIAKLIKKNEKVLIMFSGCAPYIAVISKHSKPKRIVGIEKNPKAHKFALENIKLNKLKNDIQLYCGDVKKIAPKLKEKFDRIIMPLPKIAHEFLPEALKTSKKNAIIHLYAFPEEDQISEYIKEILKKYKKLKLVRKVICGSFSPKIVRVCYDLKVR